MFSSTETENMGSTKTIRIERVDQPADPRASVSVGTIDEEITAEATATIEIGVKWNGDAAALLFGKTVPIELPCRCSRPETGLVLLSSPNGYERKMDEPECWIPDLPEDDDFGHSLGLMRRETEKGETLSCRAEIWGDHRSENPLEPGEYSFEETLSVEDDGYAKWGFTLLVET